MESASATLRYVGQIQTVEERFYKNYIRGIGDKAEFENKSMGFYLIFTDGFSVYAGDRRPDFNNGQIVTLTIEALS